MVGGVYQRDWQITLENYNNKHHTRARARAKAHAKTDKLDTQNAIWGTICRELVKVQSVKQIISTIVKRKWHHVCDSQSEISSLILRATQSQQNDGTNVCCRSEKADCVRDKANVFYSYDLAKAPPGLIISLDQHCQMVYGPKATFCRVRNIVIEARCNGGTTHRNTVSCWHTHIYINFNAHK